MGKIAFLFPGQGSQNVGMGKDFYDNHHEARQVFEQADQSLDFSVSKLCFEDEDKQLSNTAFTQPALLTASMACCAVLMKHGVKPDYLAGHSLGEYTSLVAGEYLSMTSGVDLVHRRGIIMNQAVPAGNGAMAAVLGLDEKVVQETCIDLSQEGDLVEIANYNCPGQIIISGTSAGVAQASETLKIKGAKRVLPLQVSGPFHSSLMTKASQELATVMDNVDMKKGSLPVVTNVTGALLTEPSEIKNMLVQQIKSPVLWQECVNVLVAQGVNIFIEVGPGKVLTGLVKKIAKDVTILNVEDQNSLDKTLATLEVDK